nr:hypothetical protein CCACVL1_23992 [Ipomoea batatas]
MPGSVVELPPGCMHNQPVGINLSEKQAKEAPPSPSQLWLASPEELPLLPPSPLVASSSRPIPAAPNPCLETIKELANFEVCHMYREQNRIVDTLVKQALICPIALNILNIVDDIPDELRDKLREDQLGASFQGENMQSLLSIHDTLNFGAATDGFEAVESLDLFLAKLSLRLSLCSFNLEASSFWYSAASVLALAILCFFWAMRALFLWRVNGVTSL